MASVRTVELDVRPIPVREKHPTIFRTFDGLYYAFAAERAGQFEWTYLEQGPDVWRVEIRKAA